MPLICGVPLPQLFLVRLNGINLFAFHRSEHKPRFPHSKGRKPAGTRQVPSVPFPDASLDTIFIPVRTRSRQAPRRPCNSIETVHTLSERFVSSHISWGCAPLTAIRLQRHGSSSELLCLDSRLRGTKPSNSVPSISVGTRAYSQSNRVSGRSHVRPGGNAAGTRPWPTRFGSRS